jgi:hypothetical protein
MDDKNTQKRINEAKNFWAQNNSGTSGPTSPSSGGPVRKPSGSVSTVTAPAAKKTPDTAQRKNTVYDPILSHFAPILHLNFLWRKEKTAMHAASTLILTFLASAVVSGDPVSVLYFH